mmetsp:Transcript_25543/g.65649  ORF Transcript_25543/g.65649 Transcript_25543/m.65649 type:complete len:288 (-) Transcript_25543:383-1246(-)
MFAPPILQRHRTSEQPKRLLRFVQHGGGLRPNLSKGKQVGRRNHSQAAVGCIKSAKILLDNIFDHDLVRLAGRLRILQLGLQELQQSLGWELALALRLHLRGPFRILREVDGQRVQRQDVPGLAPSCCHCEALLLLGDDDVLKSAPHAGGDDGVRVHDEDGTDGQLQSLEERGGKRPLVTQLVGNAALIVRIRADPVPRPLRRLKISLVGLQAPHKRQHGLAPPVRNEPLLGVRGLGEHLRQASGKGPQELVGGSRRGCGRCTAKISKAARSFVVVADRHSPRDLTV